MTPARVFREADALLVTAGAGMGVDSGLPDFRGNQGFWNAYPAARALGLSFAEMANPRWFAEDPAMAWAFYGHRLNLYRNTRPHPGFSQLLEAGRAKPGGVFVFTSNVDGQFQAAGFPEEGVVECHGSIRHFQCVDGCSPEIWDAPPEPVKVDMDAFRALEPLPSCPRCGGLARPNILMFGDWGWNPERTESQERRLEGWLEKVRENRWKLAVVEIGAGEAVPTVRNFSQRAAEALGGTLIRINPRDHRVPEGHLSMALGGLEGIRELVC